MFNIAIWPGGLTSEISWQLAFRDISLLEGWIYKWYLENEICICVR